MTPVTIDLHPDLSVPAYRQISDALRRHLVSGALAPGALLPPVRQLAMDLGVHFNTVAQAYRILAEEGWLDLRRLRGALIVERQTPRRADTDKVTALTARLRDIAAQLRSLGLSQAQVALALRRAAQQKPR
jgi:DNA-binding transcriptional regulator YhcF (GntR family)